MIHLYFKWLIRLHLWFLKKNHELLNNTYYIINIIYDIYIAFSSNGYRYPVSELLSAQRCNLLLSSLVITLNPKTLHKIIIDKGIDSSS